MQVCVCVYVCVCECVCARMPVCVSLLLSLHPGGKPSRRLNWFESQKYTCNEPHLCYLRRNICFCSDCYSRLQVKTGKTNMGWVHTCLSAIPLSRDNISQCSFGSTAKEKTSPKYAAQIWLPQRNIINCLPHVHLLETRPHLQWIGSKRREGVGERGGGDEEGNLCVSGLLYWYDRRHFNTVVQASFLYFVSMTKVVMDHNSSTVDRWGSSKTGER